jgi:predicted DNA-binding transcriptional regulator AlpA
MIKTRRGKVLGTAPPPRDYVTRHELLAMLPFGMSSVDALEKRGIFPKRFRLEPLRRVAWPRREVERFLALRAKRRPGQSYLGAAREDQASG